MKRSVKELSSARGLLPWPEKHLNDRLNVRPGDMVCIAGTLLSGKTTMAFACALRWARQYKVGFFYEGDPVHTLATFPDDLEDYAALNMEFLSAGSLSLENIFPVVEKHGYQIIVVDDYHLLRCSGSSCYREKDIIEMLYSLAKKLKIVVVMTHRLLSHPNNFENHPAFAFPDAVIRIESLSRKKIRGPWTVEILKNETSF